MKKLTASLLSAALVASLAISGSAFASGTGDPADASYDYPYTETTLSAPSSQEGLPAAKAADGDNDTHWHTAWDTDLSGSPESRYIQLTLNEAVELNGLRYLPRQGSEPGNENGRVTQYQIEVSTTGTDEEGAWREVASGTWDNNTSWKLAEFTPIQAQYVRLYGVTTVSDNGTANAFMSCAELRVQTTQEQEENIFLNKTASASTENSVSGERASGANDGNTDTKWCADWNGNTNPAHHNLLEEWWQVDLGDRYTVEELNVIFEAASDWQCYVAVSDDDTFAHITEIAAEDITRLSNAAEATIPVGQTGRYVRFYLMPGANGVWPCLREVSGTGTVVTTPEVTKAEVQALVDAADKERAEWYTDGWDAYAQAIAAAKEVLAGDAPTAEALANAKQAIETAKEGLVERDQYTADDPFVFPSQQDVTATLEAEFAQLNDVELESDKGWALQVAQNAWASHGEFINCLNQQDTITFYYRAPVAGTYSVRAFYRSGSATNKLEWSGEKIANGSVTAGASDDAGATHVAEFNLVVNKAGEGTLVFTGPDTKSPQLDKLEITLTKAAYSVTVNSATGGTAQANVTTAAADDTVTLTATPDTGYHFKEWQVQDGTVTITENKFTMPQGNVTITPVFEAHTYGEPTFAWAEGNTSVTATFTCDREDCGHQETATAQATSAVTKQPTCTEKGVTTYTATVSFNGEQYPASKTEENVAALGHKYGEPTFSWAEDNSSVTATFTCSVCNHEETATSNEVSSSVTKQPTCTEKGETTYTATVNFGDQDYPVSKTEADVAALGHNYGQPTFAWAQDNSSVTATFTCDRDGCGHQETATSNEVSSSVTKQPTCTEKGETTYTATVNFGDQDYPVSKTETDVAALGHNYGQPTFAWAQDNTSVTATFTCDRDGCGHQETATAQATSEVTKQPTCTDKGETTYSATVEFGGKQYPVSKTEADVAALGHNYGQPTFAWAQDNTSVTATFTCDREDCGHQETATAQAASEVTKQPTCTDKGETTYSATVEFGGKQYPASKTEENVAALGHKYGEPTFSWAEDNSSVTATFTCSVCNHEETATSNEVSSSVTKQPTCTEKGETTYTATVNFGGKDYTATKDVQDIPALGHSYGEPIFAWAEDGKSASATFICGTCQDEQTVKATITSEVKTEATCTEKGTTTYTATVEFGEKSYTDTKDVTDLPATGHHVSLVEKVEATCTQDGSKAYYVCDDCDAAFEDEEATIAIADLESWKVIPATGHDVTLVEGKAATCTEAGTKAYYVCGDCDAAFEDAEATIAIDNLDEWKVIPATGHHVTLVEGKAATCTEAGTKAYYVCDNCDAAFEDEEATIAIADLDEWKVIEATGHHYVDGVCTVCGAEDPDYVKPTDPVEPSAPVTGGDVTVDNNTDNQITVGNASEVFEANTVITVESVTQGEIFNTVKEALKGVVADMKHTAILDITATLNGKLVQPSAPVQMTFAIPQHLSADNLKLFYVSNDGKTTEEIAITVDKDARTVTANLEHFSTYVLANVAVDEGGKVPPTGDNSQLMLYVAALAAGVVLMSTTVVVSRKRRG